MTSPKRDYLPPEVKQELERHLATCGGCQRGAGEEHTFEWMPGSALRPTVGFGRAVIDSVVLSHTLDHYLVLTLLDAKGDPVYVLLLPAYQVGALKEYLHDHFPDVK